MANYITSSLKKICRTIYEPTFFKVIQGGMSAGKTFAILTLLIGNAQSFPNTLTTVVARSRPDLSRNSVRDFTHIMKNAGIFDEERWNRSSLKYTFENGSIIEFVSVDAMGARGGRRNVLFVNEANGIDWETFDQLASRTNEFCMIDYNPSSEFWAHTEILKKQAERASFLKLTYKDNEALSRQEIENIEAHAPKKGEEPSNWWRVYGLGEIGSLEGNIYQGWIPISREPNFFEHAKLVRYGIDFGFSNDETAMVAIYEDEDKRIGLKELIYETGLLGSQYPAKLASVGIDPSVLIVADGARPEIIAEIKQAGYLCIPATKGAGSILRGIDRVKARQIIYDGKDIEKEYLTYAWRKKLTGEILDVPEDKNNHALDAIRYGIDDLSRPRFDF